MKAYRPVMPTASLALALMLLVTACALLTPKVSEPQVRIAAPADGSTVLLGDTIAIRAVVEVEEPRGIASVQLLVDGQLVKQEPPPRAPVTLLAQDLLWTPTASGPHQIQVVVQNNTGVQTVSEPITLYVSADESLREAVIRAQLAATPDFFPASTSLPVCAAFTPVPTAIPTPTPTTTPVPCYDGAAYVTDVAVPDGSQFDKGTPFSKVWRLRNTGTCAWDTRYQLVFVGGSQLDAPSAVAVPQELPAGGTVDITVPMVAPDAIGTYRGQWQMRNPDGVGFGTTVHVLIEVRPGPDDPPIITRFEVVPNVISQGQSATIYWEYINGTFARLTPCGEGGVGPTGSLVISPNATTSCRLVVSNGVGIVERTTTLVVQPGPTPPSAPASPANLTVTVTRPNGFDFTWTDASPNEQGFRLYNADTKQVLATFAPNTVGGPVGGLICGTPYRFYLVAFNEGGESWPGNTVQATTGACGG